MLNGYSDKTLLDYLQQMVNEHKTRGVILKDSIVGWKLMPSSLSDGVKDVRQAIINYIEERKKNYHE